MSCFIKLCNCICSRVIVKLEICHYWHIQVITATFMLISWSVLWFTGTISVNTIRTPYQAPGESEILDLDDNLYLGGLPENKAGLVFPTEVWTALLNYGFVGCVRDLFIDGQSKDVRRMAESQKATGVKPSCSKEAPKQCISNPCLNNGVCREGWNRYVCDCSGTGFLGRSCERGRGCCLTLLLRYRLSLL